MSEISSKSSYVTTKDYDDGLTIPNVESLLLMAKHLNTSQYISSLVSTVTQGREEAISTFVKKLIKAVRTELGCLQEFGETTIHAVSLDYVSTVSNQDPSLIEHSIANNAVTVLCKILQDKKDNLSIMCGILDLSPFASKSHLHSSLGHFIETHGKWKCPVSFLEKDRMKFAALVSQSSMNSSTLFIQSWLSNLKQIYKNKSAPFIHFFNENAPETIYFLILPFIGVPSDISMRNEMISFLASLLVIHIEADIKDEIIPQMERDAILLLPILSYLPRLFSSFFDSEILEDRDVSTYENERSIVPLVPLLTPQQTKLLQKTIIDKLDHPQPKHTSQSGTISHQSSKSTKTTHPAKPLPEVVSGVAQLIQALDKLAGHLSAAVRQSLAFHLPIILAVIDNAIQTAVGTDTKPWQIVQSDISRIITKLLATETQTFTTVVHASIQPSQVSKPPDAPEMSSLSSPESPSHSETLQATPSPEQTPQVSPSPEQPPEALQGTPHVPLPNTQPQHQLTYSLNMASIRLMSQTSALIVSRGFFSILPFLFHRERFDAVNVLPGNHLTDPEPDITTESPDLWMKDIAVPNESFFPSLSPDRATLSTIGMRARLNKAIFHHILTLCANRDWRKREYAVELICFDIPTIIRSNPTFPAGNQSDQNRTQINNLQMSLSALYRPDTLANHISTFYSSPVIPKEPAENKQAAPLQPTPQALQTQTGPGNTPPNANPQAPQTVFRPTSIPPQSSSIPPQPSSTTRPATPSPSPPPSTSPSVTPSPKPSESQSGPQPIKPPIPSSHTTQAFTRHNTFSPPHLFTSSLLPVPCQPPPLPPTYSLATLPSFVYTSSFPNSKFVPPLDQFSKALINQKDTQRASESSPEEVGLHYSLVYSRTLARFYRASFVPSIKFPTPPAFTEEQKQAMLTHLPTSFISGILSLLGDQSARVRETAAIGLAYLASMLPNEWMEDYLIPLISTMKDDMSAIHRHTFLNLMEALAEVACDMIVEDYLLPFTAQLLDDSEFTVSSHAFGLLVLFQFHDTIIRNCERATELRAFLSSIEENTHSKYTYNAAKPLIMSTRYRQVVKKEEEKKTKPQKEVDMPNKTHSDKRGADQKGGRNESKS